MNTLYLWLVVTVMLVVNLSADTDQAKKVEKDEEAIFTLTGDKAADTDALGQRKLYHWPALTGLPYVSAEFVDYPDGDIAVRRAFYWGRALGSDGLHLSLRTFTTQAGDDQMARPFVETEEERQALTDRLTRFQKLYARYGCGENALGFYMDKPQDGQDLQDFKDKTYKYTRQRAELAKAAQIPNIMLDMEWSNLSQLKEKIGPREACLFAWELGKEVMRAVNDAYPQVRFWFYPGLTSFQYNIENRINPEHNRFSDRVAFVQGMYDNRATVKIFNFCGWTYNATDQCTGTKWWNIKKAPFVHDTYYAMERVIYAHHWMLGDDIGFAWGRWEMGGHRYTKPGVPGLAMIKLANVPLVALERTWLKHYEKSDMVWVWDHFNSWDEDGSLYVTINNDEEMAGFDKWLAEVDPAYHKLYDTVTGEYWITGTPGSGFHGAKRDMFRIQTKDGVTHITGILDPAFAKYVNLTKELAGRDRDTIPLYSQEDLDLAKEYQDRGFFPYQEITTVSDEPGVVGYLKPLPKTESVLGNKLQ